MQYKHLKLTKLFLLASLKTVVASALIASAMGFVTAWQSSAEVESELAGWTDSTDYAVFYPRSIGDDLEALMAGENGVSRAVAESIAPELSARGGIYVEAYGMDVVGDRTEMSYPSLIVNPEYLKHYPVLDADGRPIEVADDERDWIIAVPESLKDEEDAIRAYVQDERNGTDSEDESAMEYSERRGYKDGSSIADQKVRIIWTQPGQDLFTFNTQIRPAAGNTLLDPVVTIMTKNNTIASDWENTITGEIDTPMKVKVDGDPAGVYLELLPLLKEQELDDNFLALVYPADAISEQFSMSAEDARWMITAIVITGVITLEMSVIVVALACERQRVSSAIRRLHGWTRARSHREVLTRMALSWIGLLPGTFVAATGLFVLGPFVPILAHIDPFLLLDDWPTILGLTGAFVAVETVLVLAVVAAFDRRHPALRLKEV